jgi:hypothetical protein
MQGQSPAGFITLGSWWTQQFNGVINPTNNGYIFGDDEFIIQICDTQIFQIDFTPGEIFPIHVMGVQFMVIYAMNPQTIFIEVE